MCRHLAATAAGDSLWHRRSERAVVVASEPGDDEPGWAEVPGGSVLTATARDVQVTRRPTATPDTTTDGRIAIP